MSECLEDFLAVSPTSTASSRARLLDWLERLAPGIPVVTWPAPHAPLGRSAHPLSLLVASKALTKARRSGVGGLLIHDSASPLGWGQVDVGLMRSSAWSVYDIGAPLHFEPRVRARGRLGSGARRAIHCMKLADRVIAGNDVIAEWVGQFAKEVVVIPTCVAPEDYRLKWKYEIAGPPRIVWLGRRGTENELAHVAPGLLEAHRRWGARLSASGIGRSNLGPLEPMVDRVHWGLGTAEERLGDFDLGIVPAVDCLRNRARTPYEVLQMAAAGLPVVASPVGPSASVLAAMGGVGASGSQEWFDALGMIIESPVEQRRRMGLHGHRAVLQRFSFTTWAERWADAAGVRLVGRALPFIERAQVNTSSVA